jgi:hypothetical protein
MGPAKIVARYADGRVLKGFTRDFSPDASRFHLLTAPLEPRGEPVEVEIADLKAVFFVRDFAGNPAYRERKAFGRERTPGRRLAVVFEDGETLVGSTMGYDPRRPGFFLFPADGGSNNLRVFAVATAVRQVRPAVDSPEPETVERADRGGGTMVDPKLIGNIQSVVSVLRQTVSDWEAVVRGVEALTDEHEALRARCQHIERDYQALQAAHTRVREERDETLQSLSELRTVHEALRAECEAATRGLSDLRAQHEAALRERQSAASELATILRRLQG